MPRSSDSPSSPGPRLVSAARAQQRQRRQRVDARRHPLSVSCSPRSTGVGGTALGGAGPAARAPAWAGRRRARRRLGAVRLRGEAQVLSRSSPNLASGIRRPRTGPPPGRGPGDRRACAARGLQGALEPDRAAVDLAATRRPLGDVASWPSGAAPSHSSSRPRGRTAPAAPQPVRHLPDRRAGNDKQPVSGEQAKQRRRHPGGEPFVERPGGGHAERPPAVRTTGQPPPACACNSVGTPLAMWNRPTRRPAGAVQPISAGGSAAFLSGWRMNRPPTSANKAGTANDALADGRARQGIEALDREVVHPGPDRGGEHDRQRDQGQPEAVALVVGVQLPRVAAEAADDAANQVRHRQPGRRDDAQQPRR